jgi:hypothetical protein
MRSLYEPVNHKRRADNHRRAAEECERAGFRTLAQVNWQMAEFLDPPPPDEDYY